MEKSQLTVGEAKWEEVWPEGDHLFKEHETELGLGSAELPHEVDFELAAKLAAAGNLRIVAGHNNGVLVGYCFWFLSPSLLSRGKIVADQGPYFVKPELRQSSLGLRLWRASLEMLRSAGVAEVLAHAFVGSPEGLAKLFERSRAEPLAQVWRIRL